MIQAKATLILEENFVPDPKKLISVLYGGIPFDQAVRQIISEIQGGEL